MTVAATILARAAFEIVRRSFASVGSDELKTFRIKNLSNGESLEFLKVWQERSADSDLAEVQVVVASDSAEEFPDRYRADPQRSITWYRNNIKGGLVYVETKVESDEQGLKNLFTLQDQDYLGGVFDTDDFQVADYMVRQTIPGGPLAAAPGDLVSARIQEVLQHFKAFGTPIPVRRFLLFVSKVRRPQRRRVLWSRKKRTSSLALGFSISAFFLMATGVQSRAKPGGVSSSTCYVQS